MSRRHVRARDLLTRAAERYDATASPLRAAAAGAAFGGFASGAQWMRLALENVRGRPCPPGPSIAKCDARVGRASSSSSPADNLGTSSYLTFFDRRTNPTAF